MSTKTFASGLTFQLGLMTLVADAVPIKRTGADKATAFSLVCPHCSAKPSQKYECPECEKLYYPSELAKAKEVDDGTFRKMTDEELQRVKDSTVDPGLFVLQVCPRADLEAATSPSGQSYRVRLGKGKQAKLHANAYALIRAMAAQDEYALYGVCRLNGKCSPTPFRLKVWRDQLLLEGLVRPQDLTEPEVIEGAPDAKLLEMGQALLGALAAPLNADSLSDERAKVLADILKDAEGSEPAPSDVKPQAEEVDLMAALAASLQAA